MDFHPISGAFPLMEGEEFRELVEDIAKNGQQQPILTHEGKILDGRNRYRACVEAGVEPWVERWYGDSPVEAVKSLNLHRRNLSKSQRAAIAAELEEFYAKEAKKRQREHGNTAPGRTKTLVGKMPQVKARDRAAADLDVSPRYVSDAKKLRREDPEAHEAVKRGEKTLPRAMKPLKGEDRRPAKEVLAGQDIDLPPWDLSKERKAYYSISKHLVGLSRLDPEKVAEGCKEEYDVQVSLEHTHAITDWLGRFESALEARRRELGPGNLRVVGDE